MKLYYNFMCPFSRQAKVYLKELGVKFTIITIHSQSQNYNKLLPTLEEDQELIEGIYPITEYIIEKYSDFYLIDNLINEKAKIRKFIFLYNNKFYNEVTKIIVHEKLSRLLLKIGSPRTDLLRIAKNNLGIHFNYINEILNKQDFIATEKLTISDIVAATQLSIVDYFGEINWIKWPKIKHWYALIKSRPAFRALLQDKISGINPPQYYNQLDF